MSLYKGTTLISGAIPDMANQSLSNLDSAGQDKFDEKVNKSGDTMRGTLIVSSSENSNQIIAQGMQIDKTVIPTTNNLVSGLKIIDKNNAELGSFYYRFDTAGSKRCTISCIGNNNTAFLTVGLDTNETPYSTFPNTTRCDGQFIPLWRDLISVDTSLNGSSELPYTIPEIANKGFFHMALITMTVNTGASSGNYVNGEIRSYISNIVSILRVRTRTASTMTSSGSCWIPVGVDGKIYVNRNTSWNGSMSVLRCMGYRRIGYNENA